MNTVVSCGISGKYIIPTGTATRIALVCGVTTVGDISPLPCNYNYVFQVRHVAARFV